MENKRIIEIAMEQMVYSAEQIIKFSETVLREENVDDFEKTVVLTGVSATFLKYINISAAVSEELFAHIMNNKNEGDTLFSPENYTGLLAQSFLKIDGNPEKAFEYTEKTYDFRVSGDDTPETWLEMYPMIAASFHVRNQNSQRMFETLEAMKKHEEELCVANRRAEVLIEEFRDDSALGLGAIQAVNREYDAIRKLEL